MPNLFSEKYVESQVKTLDVPLAHALRPQTLEEFFGQEELVGQEKMLRQLIENDQLHSVIFFGPPGSGKTTLATIIANKTAAEFEVMSAVTGGVPELRKIIVVAKERKKLGQKTVLFVDEIHRFNKAQQDALLPHVEDGTIVLIGATTENPSFEVISALLSRSQVFVFKSLDENALRAIVRRALQKISEMNVKKGSIAQKDLNVEESMGFFRKLTSEAEDFLVRFANGDARLLLNTLEIILKVTPQKKSFVKSNVDGENRQNQSNTKDPSGIIDQREITLGDVQKVLQRKNLRYDKKGEEHYNIISALHKSMRDSDPDGALYWLARMLEGGEDPLYVARRLIRFASEDIGMADPHALLVAVAAKDACHFLGMPECSVNLAQAVIHLSVTPKSNSAYVAYGKASKDARDFGNLEVPLHIRNAPTKLMKEWGYGKDYKYAHNYEDAYIDQQHLPDELKGRVYYKPTDRGIEGKIRKAGSGG